MKTSIRWILGILIALVVIAFCYFIWPGPQIRNAMSTLSEVAKNQAALPTRDPMIGQLATSQAQQEQVLSAMATQLAQPTATQIQPTVTTTPTANPTSGIPEVVSTSVTALPVQSGEWPSNLFRTPVQCQKSFNTESSWLICEPGVLLDNTAAWTIPGTNEPWFINIPEGGFTYFSMGEGKILIDGVTLDLPGEKGLNYLVVIRGRIDDGIVDSDLNETAKVTNFIPGHAIWSIMPPGAYVSYNWLRDQLVVSTTTTGTNCGATGCSRTIVVLFDVGTHFEQRFEVHAGDLDNWVQK
jgi:hypothetical protein